MSTDDREKEERVTPNYAKTVAVVELLGQATSSQIERLVFSAPGTKPGSRASRTRRTLTTLVRRGRLKAYPSIRTGISSAPWSGWVYLPGDTKAAVGVKPHELDQAQMYVELKEAQQRGDLKILDLAIREPIRENSQAHDDLYVWLESPSGKVDWHVEIDRGSEYKPAIMTKLRAYTKAMREAAAARQPYPYVLFVVTYDPIKTVAERIAELRGWIRRQPVPELFRVCSFDDAIPVLLGEKEA